MANLRALPFVAVAALILAPAALAQTPTPVAPTVMISSFAAAPDTATIPLGGSMTFNLTVTVSFHNVFCQAGATSSVALVMGGAGLPGVEGTPPGTIPITIAANVNPPTAPAQDTTGTGTGQFLVKVAPNAAPNHDHTFMLNATYTAGLPPQCTASPADTFPQSPLVTKSIMVKTGPAAGNQTSTTGPSCMGATCTSMPPTTTKASPLADVPTVALLVLAVALVASRRHA